MKKISLGFGFLLLMFCVLFSSNAFAQAGGTGIDLKVSLYAPLLDQTIRVSEDGGTRTSELDEIYAGIGGSIAAGYSWGNFGIYLEQDLGGLWFTGEADKNNDKSWFIGGTYVVARGIYAVMSQLQIDFGIGVGVMYSDGNKLKDAFKSGYKIPLIYDKDYDPTAAFAMKFALSGTYFFASNMGVGINFDYNLGINPKEQDILWFNVKTTQLLHHMTPGLHFRMLF